MARSRPEGKAWGIPTLRLVAAIDRLEKSRWLQKQPPGLKRPLMATFL
jgi:hypothetical protein